MAVPGRSFFPVLILLPLLMVDAIIEVGLIGSMVGFLHDRAGKSFTVSPAAGSSFELHGKPAGLLVNQGHTSNGAAGTAFVLVGIGGFLMIWLERKRTIRTQSTRPSPLFTAYLIFTILSTLLTLAALIYTFVLTHDSHNQRISLSLAAANPELVKYPADTWTPENWFLAVLDLPLVEASDRRKIGQQIRLMRGWRWNLIPLLIIELAVCAALVGEWVKARRGERGFSGKRELSWKGEADGFLS